MPESINYSDLKKDRDPIVYVLQEIAGTREGSPKINIMGASQYGKIKFLLDEKSRKRLRLLPKILPTPTSGQRP